jgi:hypothetical protein
MPLGECRLRNSGVVALAELEWLSHYSSDTVVCAEFGAVLGTDVAFFVPI